MKAIVHRGTGDPSVLALVLPAAPARPGTPRSSSPTSRMCPPTHSARWAGATVIATVSGPAKARLATAAGAHHVVNYREGDPAAESRGAAEDITAALADGALPVGEEHGLPLTRFPLAAAADAQAAVEAGAVGKVLVDVQSL